MNTGDFSMLKMMVCTLLQHTHTIPSNASGGENRTGWNMHPRQLIISTSNKRSCAGSRVCACERAGATVPEISAIPVSTTHTLRVLSLEAETERRPGVPASGHFTVPRSSNRTIPNPDSLILHLPIQPTRPGDCA